jgi:hypothetical protein
MKVQIVMTELYYDQIRHELFPPGDSDEHFMFGLTGFSRYRRTCNILLRSFIHADKSCVHTQSGANVRPKREFTQYVWALAKKSNSGLIDFHTHPFSETHVRFSGIDDASEADSFPKAVKSLGDGPHASIVFGRDCMDARWYDPKAKELKPVTTVKVLGDKLINIIPTSSLLGYQPAQKLIRKV